MALFSDPLAFRDAKSSAIRSTVERNGEDCLRDLMIAYQQGDPAAVDELVDALSPMLSRYLASPYVSQADVEDLLQDCWLRIHRARHTYRPAEPVLPWIFAIARHTRLDAYRKRRRLGSREVSVAELPEPAWRSGQPPGRETAALGLLGELPESQREVLIMLKVIGMSLEEVARATASTTGAVKQKAHRAYVTLRQMLEKKR